MDGPAVGGCQIVILENGTRKIAKTENIEIQKVYMLEQNKLPPRYYPII